MIEKSAGKRRKQKRHEQETKSSLFQMERKALDPDNAEAVTIRLITAIDSTTKIIWKTELTLVEEKMKKSCNRPGNTQRRLLK